MEIKEYILNISNEVFRVYAFDKTNAEQTFIRMCNKYSNVDNPEHKQHWQDLIDLFFDNAYTIIENLDFEGVRKI